MSILNVISPGGGSSGCSSEDIYSTGETVIGKWIDGKPLYRKVVKVTLPGSTGIQTMFQLGEGVTIHFISGYSYDATNDTTFFVGTNYENGTFDLWFKPNEKVIEGQIGSQLIGKEATIILEYTKTTDLAGGGRLTWWSPHMTSNNTPEPYAAIGDAYKNDPITQPYLAFDGIYGDDKQWYVDEKQDHSIVFDFGKETMVYGIRMMPSYRESNSPMFFNRSYRILGSKDGAVYETIKDVTPYPDYDVQAREWYEVQLGAAHNFRYIKIQATGNTYSNYDQAMIGEIEFLVQKDAT